MSDKRGLGDVLECADLNPTQGARSTGVLTWSRIWEVDRVVTSVTRRQRFELIQTAGDIGVNHRGGIGKEVVSHLGGGFCVRRMLSWKLGTTLAGWALRSLGGLELQLLLLHLDVIRGSQHEKVEHLARTQRDHVGCGACSNVRVELATLEGEVWSEVRANVGRAA